MRFFLFALILTLSRCEKSREVRRNEATGLKSPLPSNSTLNDIFESAVQAYLEENWRGCVEGFEEAMHRVINEW